MGYFLGFKVLKITNYKNITMKNSFKIAALALVVSISVAACGGGKKKLTVATAQKLTAQK